MNDLELARWLYGNNQIEDNTQRLTAGRTRTYTGIALSDSTSGSVIVDMGGNNVSPDGGQGVEVPCIPSVTKGDRVYITVVNGSPYVSGVIGWGDSLAEAAQDAASEAAKTATNYMIFDNNGLVIGNLTENTLGRNVLIDLDSVDIRDGEDVLASFGETTVIGAEDTSNIELGKYLGVGFAYNINGRAISGQYSDVAYLKLSNSDGTSTIEFTEQNAEQLNNDVAVFNGIECKNGNLHARFGTSIYGDDTERIDLESSHPLFIAVGGRIGCKATPIQGQYILISAGAVVFSHPALWLAAIGAAASSHNHAASDINSGTFDTARIPSLAASIITSGTFDVARIPDLAASKITSGTFSADRIPNLNTSKFNAGTLGIARGGTGKSSVTAGNYLVGNGTSALTEKTPAEVLSDIGAAASSHEHAASDISSGTLDAARIPSLAASKITSGTFDAARIPNLAASKINSGTFGVARGGTGKASVTAGSYLVGNGTSALTEKTPAQVLSDIGALPLTGGNINGAFKVIGNNIKAKSASIADNVTPDANHSGAGFYMVDNTDTENNLGYVRSRAQTNGRQGIQVAAVRNGVDNTLGLYIDGSGNRIVAVTDQEAWRTGIGANSATNLTEGTLNVARLPASVQSSSASQITINSTNFTLTNIYTNIALGKVITVNLVLKPAQALTAKTEYSVGTLAAGLRPYVTTHATTNHYADIAQVTGSGAITYWPSEARSTSNTVRISFTYVLA